MSKVQVLVAPGSGYRDFGQCFDTGDVKSFNAAVLGIWGEKALDLDNGVIDVQGNHAAVWVHDPHDPIGVDPADLGTGIPHGMSHQLACRIND